MVLVLCSEFYCSFHHRCYISILVLKNVINSEFLISVSDGNQKSADFLKSRTTFVGKNYVIVKHHGAVAENALFL